MKNLLTLLSIIIKHYSKQPIKHLFDNHLFVQVYLFAQYEAASNFITRMIPNLHKSKKKILINLQTSLVYVKITHQNEKINKNLLKNLLTQLENCLLVYQKSKFQDQQNQCSINIEQNHECFDNIFNKFRQKTTENFNMKNKSLSNDIKNQTQNVKGIFINITKQKNYSNKNQAIQRIKDEIHAHLSVCQLFHAHTNLILSLNQIKKSQQIDSQRFRLLNELKTSTQKKSGKQILDEDDQNNFLQDSYYCRIFQSRASKVALDDLSEFCSIQTYLWGQLLTIAQGVDGLIIWTLKDSFPILEDIQILNFNHFVQKDRSLKLCEAAHGKLIFKVKNKAHLKNDELNFHVVILNFKQGYAKNRKQIFESQFEKQLKKFKCLKTKTKQQLQLEQDIGDIEQLCQNLKLDSYPVVRWLFFQQNFKKNE